LLAWLALTVVCGTAVYALLAVAIRWLRHHAVAHPNARSSHTLATPQGAGVVIIPVALVGAATPLALGLAPPATELWHLIAIAAAALGLMLVGFWDDTQSLPVLPRLVMQTAAVLLVILTLPNDARLLPIVPTVLERLALFLAVLWFVNAANFMDGIDWMSVVETAAISLGVIVLAALSLVPPALGWHAAALLGVMIGFMPWNAPAARVFLGDAGSLPLGLLLATLLLHVAVAGEPIAALILPLYYLGDATVTLVGRMARGERVWEAHRGHFYQRAVKAGDSVHRVLAYVGLLNAALVGIALLTAKLATTAAAVAGLMLAVVLVGLTLRRFGAQEKT